MGSKDAAVVIEAWRRHYQAVLPHSSLNDLIPHGFKRHNPVHPTGPSYRKNWLEKTDQVKPVHEASSSVAELYLIRHGQASFGAADYDCLSDIGVRQSRMLGEYLAAQGRRFERIFTGSMRRHWQTVDGLLQGLGGDVVVEEHAGLNEYDFQTLLGIACGHGHLPVDLRLDDRREFFRALRNVLRLWADDRLPGAPETWQQFQQRVAAARERIRACGARQVLAVSSGGAIGVMMQQVLDASVATAIELNLQLINSSICRFAFNEQVFRLVAYNSVSHLERDGFESLVTYA